MAGLVEKDPQLAAVIDKNSGRNLLDPKNPTPLALSLAAGKPVRFALEVKNGEAGLIDLAISSDEGWLEPEQSRLTLVGGESRECIVRAVPGGDADFANLLFSWEGNTQTLCQSVIIQRELPPSSKAPEKSPASAAASGKPKEEKSEVVQKLINFIKGCAPDSFIDYNEEQQIFRKGGALDLAPTETESILNKLCSEGGWTRQTRLTEKLTAMLVDATKDDGVIDEQEFEHVVGFAVKRNMPRRDADEHCITLMLNNGWKAKESFWNPWFSRKRKQIGL